MKLTNVYILTHTYTINHTLINFFFIHTGGEHLDLIFEFAKWVLKEHPEDGLKVKRFFGF